MDVLEYFESGMGTEDANDVEVEPLLNEDE